MEWSQQQLSDIKSDFFQKNPVSLYIMGENRWRSEQEWPLSDAIPTKYYLHSDVVQTHLKEMVSFQKLSQQIMKKQITIYQTLLIQYHQLVVIL